MGTTSFRYTVYSLKRKGFSIHTALPLLRAAAGLHRSCSKGRRAGPLCIARVLLEQAVEGGEDKKFDYPNFFPRHHKIASGPVTHIHNKRVPQHNHANRKAELNFRLRGPVMALQLSPTLNNACLVLLVHTNRVHGGGKG